jgi:hypothetical protein
MIPPLLVLLATAPGNTRRPEGLGSLGAVEMLVDTRPGWSEAANALLDAAAERGAGALFLDDDITWTPDATRALLSHRGSADMLGFDLWLPQGHRQFDVHHVLTPFGTLAGCNPPGPCELAHVSTSCCYLSARLVADRRVRFPVWPGTHYEDVAYALTAWLHGYTVAYVGGTVIHAMAGPAGATKGSDPHTFAKQAMNQHYLGVWCVEQGIRAAVEQGRIPAGVRPITEREVA